MIALVSAILRADERKPLGINRYASFLIVSGCALRFVLSFWYIDFSDPKLWEFGVIARNLVETGVYSYLGPGTPSAFIPPAYPLVIGLMYKVFGLSTTAHILLGILLLIFEC